jgi:hypothetical protein
MKIPLTIVTKKNSYVVKSWMTFWANFLLTERAGEGFIDLDVDNLWKCIDSFEN